MPEDLLCFAECMTASYVLFLRSLLKNTLLCHQRESAHSILSSKTTIQEPCVGLGRHSKNRFGTGGTFGPRKIETRIEELSCLSVETLIVLLQLFYSIEKNIYTLPTWSRLEHWHESWAWPIGLDYVPENDLQCDHCCDLDCQCIISCFPKAPDVRPCGRKGLCLIAATRYGWGDRVGQLVGRIGPPGQFADGWAYDLRRSDIDCEPDVGQVYCRDAGNCFRFLNHSCGEVANAGIQIERISGKVGAVVFARREISPGQEITVNWGKGYLDGKVCFCDGCPNR